MAKYSIIPLWFINTRWNRNREGVREQMGFMTVCESFLITPNLYRGWDILLPIVLVRIQVPDLVTVPLSVNKPLG